MRQYRVRVWGGGSSCRRQGQEGVVELDSGGTNYEEEGKREKSVVRKGGGMARASKSEPGCVVSSSGANTAGPLLHAAIQLHALVWMLSIASMT